MCNLVCPHFSFFYFIFMGIQFSDFYMRVVFVFVWLHRNFAVDPPLKFNELDGAYNVDRRSYTGKYEVVDGVPRLDLWSSP